jgi:O-antigen/teichoic acid export membrane protein
MVIAAPYIRELSGIDIVTIMQVLAISVFAIGAKQAYGLALHSRMQFVHVQAMKTIDRLAYLIWVVVFLVVFERGVEGVVYAYVLSSLTSLTLYAPYLYSLYRGMLANQSKDDWQPFVTSSWGRGRWVIGTDLVNTFTGTVWPWIVGFFLGVEAVGTIGIVLLLLGQVSSFVPISYVLRAVLPRTVESPERLREWLFRSMKFSMWGHMLSGVLAFGACMILFPWWFPQHVAALPLFAALLLSLPLRGLATSASEWFYATGHQQDFFLVSAVPKVVILAALPLFLFAGGIVGYALWYLLSADVMLYARMRRISASLGSSLSISFLMRFDAVDRDLLMRAYALARTKITARFSR